MYPGSCSYVTTLCAAPVAASTPAEIPLWSNGAPGSEGKSAKEDVTTSASGELRVAGIHNPTITPYLPAEAETASGLAILVIPGGGHRMLAITHEGYNVAEWFQAHGRCRIRPEAPARERAQLDISNRGRVAGRHEARDAADSCPREGMERSIRPVSELLDSPRAASWSGWPAHAAMHGDQAGCRSCRAAIVQT